VGDALIHTDRRTCQRTDERTCEPSRPFLWLRERV